MAKFLKTDILSHLTSLFERQSSLLTLWLGGSKATGLEDELSDLDFIFVVTDASRAFIEIESCINTRYEIERCWQNGNQRFYILKDTLETFYLDIVIMKESDDIAEYFNFERHGKPYVLFDKIAILTGASLPQLQRSHQFDSENEVAKFEVIYRTFLKEIKRGKFIDAYCFYYRLVNIFVSTLRFSYTPQKHDFSLRYLTIDFPAEKTHLIENLLKLNSLEEMSAKARELKSSFYQFLELK